MLRPMQSPVSSAQGQSPAAMRAKVDEEIDRLSKEDIISPVKWSEWAVPVVPILKPDGHVRL